MASQPNSSSSGYEMSQDEKRHKSRRWRGLFAIAIASCLLALIAAPLWSLIGDHRQSITDDTTTATTVDTNPRRTKPNPDEMHFTSDGGAGGAVYVWPQRLAADDADVVVQATNERHYRRRRDLVWHPHPSYQLTLQDGSSWGRLDLEPAGDDQLFVSGRADVIQLIDEANNVSSSMKPDDWRPLRGCFYRGQVVQHPPLNQQAGAAAPGRDSKVVLSLCHGLTGHIRTSGGSFFIEPSPLTDGNRVDHSQTTGAVRHVIYRVRHPFRFEQPLPSSSTSRPVRAQRDDSHHHPPSDGAPPDEPEEEVDVGGRRRRRSVSQERFVEILVVADGKMVSYHGDNLVHYILTLMSVVSLIYKDASLGNPVQIAVVRMLLLKDQEFVLTTATGDDSASSSKESHEILDSRPGKSASEMLRNFCKWQRVFNDMDDSSPYHHDTALLLTRENICRNPQLQKCDTLGLAELGTMCDSSNSCSIVQDNGLSAAFTIAHELGHVLNMPHDDDFKCQQFVESTGGVHNVMSRMLDHNTFPWAWSNCSRYFITEYLDGGYGECLLDKPSTDLLDAHRAAKKLPGENFDENKQCELVFGHGSKICPYMPPCKRLWCTTSGGEQEGCRTQHMPWADGTACGRGRWCRHGTCLSRDVKSLEPVDGNWGSWQEWMMGTCSRTCGGGVQRSTRNCDNPAPSNGGTFCLGKRVRYRSCNIQECPAGTPDFREKQCSDFNSNNFNIQGLPADVKWVPKYAGISVKDRCRLYCRVEQSSAYYLLKDKVIDGTSCGPDTDDICVNGICKPASCNHVLGRKEQLDLCGVCGGDNSTCVILNGGYNSTQYGYNTVTRIPAGSSSLDIRQRGYQGSNRDDNYLALMDPQTGEYLLNGNFVVSMFQKTIQFGGTTIEYTGSDAVVERLNSSKPLKKDVVVQVLSVGNLYSPDIWYQYVVSRAEGKSPSYHWKLQEQWSACSKLCHGQQFRKPICVQATGGFQKMPEEYCSASPPPPPTETQPCQTQCILRWRVIHHSECSAHCGMGVRNVTKQCEQETLLPQQQQQQHPSAHTVPVDDRHCRHLNDPPPDTEPCKGTCHSAHWQFHPWSQCSLTCGGGVQTRKAHCVDLNGRVIADSNCPVEERVLRQSCHMESCPRWEVGEWTPCSVSCGTGERQRGYWCQLENHVIAKSYCYPVRPPVHKEACHMGDCPQWHATQWGQCSVTCGVGQAERIVGCRMENGSVVDSTFCAGQDRPASIQQCVEYPCPTEPPTTTSTSTTQATPTTQQPSTTAIFPTSAVPAASLALAGFRPQPMEIHNIDPAINSLDPTDWNPESNDIPRIVAAWRTGTWGQCSSTCDGGYRMRTVVCYDMMASREVDQAHCSDPAPVGVEKCAAHPCAAWIPHNWTSCSVTCGMGVSVRVVECQFLLNNSGAPDEMCSALEKPPTEKSCSAALAVCIGSPISHSVSVEHNHTSKMPQWRTGSWGSCSKTCGAGFKRRQVVCHDELFKDSDGCIPAKRPQDTVHCNTDPCPTWSSGEWSSCSKSCGGGTQTRPVTCRDHLGQTLPDHRCHPAGRPEYSQSCHTDPCPTEPPVPEKTYRWKTAAWTTCSKTCGKGDQYREVYCQEVEGRVRVDENRCPESSRPRSRRGCNKAACPYSWEVENWSECSHPCGAGIQHRRVTCHRVNSHEWIDPEPVSFGCNSTQRPADLQECSLGNCHALYAWRASAWQPCTASKCGRQGFQKRSLACVNSRTGSRVSRSYCPQEFRPIRKRRCRASPCGYVSCKDVQLRSATGKDRKTPPADGPYTLIVAGKNMTIYCHLMNTSSPLEYLTLTTGHQDNYAEVYDKTLIRPDSCPYQGARKDSCDCFLNRRSTGTTSFNKIRLNVTSLRVDSHDFTFARLVRGHQMVGYGEAGDCYSTANCPQGRFSINLQGTGLRVSPHTSWAGHGHRSSLWINRLEDNQKIQGKCGGYCGRCSPDPHAGLKLDVV
ncbi:A disintegrin and metalloproteinase with thrombospondin motifs 9-like isoform X3 [Daphnia pulex]|uniref:A disintegrin and metalloproteinase with thrombospondin motifs 9-like isoform X3 n=1 Tax=Daphnia pulex TaxID=6669 RepID=UPI001EE01DE1|nr:A disintegrin and metalloproteinase with thrombospondin motifs 9-like isoform X3 [Daphnia pulex]